MTLKRIFVGLILLDFAALTLWAAASESLPAAFAATAEHPWMLQTSVDLAIALTFGGVFIWRDAKARGVSPWPWIVALPLGSLTLLAYVVLRPKRAAARELAVS